MDNKLEKITIEGTTAWCNPFEPNTKFEKPHGVYDIGIVVGPEQSEKLCAYLNAIAEKKMAQVIKEAPENKREALKGSLSIVKAGVPSKDKDDNLTGDTLFKAKLKPVVENRDGSSWEQKPTVFDAKLTPITTPIQIKAGSHVRVNVECIPYMMQSNKTVGVSLRFKQLQIIKLKEGEQDTGGFEVVEGGYVANAVAKDNSRDASFEDDIPSSDGSDEGDF